MNEGAACRGTQGDLTAACCIDPYGTKAVFGNGGGVLDDNGGSGCDDEEKKSGGCGR